MLNVQIYSRKPLPRDFRLPENPYSHGEDAKAVLQHLGVIFYRDENNGHGLVLAELTEMTEGYYSQLIMDEEIMEVDEWSESMMARSTKKLEDAKAWVVHNKKVRVMKVTPSEVVAMDKDLD
jgi:hypothetical protein